MISQHARLIELFNSFDKEEDVTIQLMFSYCVTKLKSRKGTPEPWQMQQRLGCIVHRANEILKSDNLKIVPGERKQTYRLTKLNDTNS